MRLGPAAGSAGASVLPMKSMLKSKLFCESEGGQVIQRKFRCTVPLHALITCCHKISKESKILFLKFKCVWPVFCPSSPEYFFSLFFCRDCTGGRHLLCFINFLCGRYILNSNLSEKIALLTCFQCSDAFGRSVIVLTGCKWINGSFCQKLWIIQLLLVLFSSL